MSEQALSYILPGLVIVVLILLALRYRHRLALASLSNQLLITFLGVTGISVAVVVIAVLWQIQNTLIQSESERFTDVAQLNSQQLSRQLLAQISRLQDEAEKSVLASTADAAANPLDSLLPGERQIKIQQQEQEWIDRHFSPALQIAYLSVAKPYLDDFVQNAPVYAQIILVDRYGRMVTTAGLEGEHYYYGNQTWWQKAWHNGEGEMYVGGLRMLPDDQTMGVEVVIPVYSLLQSSSVGTSGTGGEIRSGKRLVGVLYMLLRLDELLALDKMAMSDEAYKLMVVDIPTGLILHSSNKSETGQKIPAYVQKYIENPSISGNSDETGQSILFGGAKVKAPEDAPYLASLNWMIIVQQPEAEVVNVGRFLRPVLEGGLIALIVTVVVGYGVSWRLTRPIATLTNVTTAMAGGQFDQTAPLTGAIEFRALAQAFNSMTGQLRQTLSGLEQRVAARTERLEIVATLSERLNAILKLDELLAEVVYQIQNKFGFYHAHIYLLDADHENLVVAAGTGPAGAEMKAQGHHIPLNTMTSLVARSARSGEIVRVDNVRETEDWLPNPLLPDTYSEMAVPIILEGQVVGVLDVQQNEIAGLDEGDAALLRSLANQVAVAIRNARLFEEVASSLHEVREAQRLFIEQAWDQSKVQRRGINRIQFSLGESTTLSETDLAEARREAFARQEPAVVTLNPAEDHGAEEENRSVTTGTGANHQALVAPITLSEVKIGNLQLHGLDPNRAWTEGELALIKAVLDQVAQTAENLRLINETQERASREQFISRASDKLRRAPDMQTLMRVAVDEISRALNPARTFVRFDVKAEADQTNGGNGTASPTAPPQFEAETGGGTRGES